GSPVRARTEGFSFCRPTPNRQLLKRARRDSNLRPLAPEATRGRAGRRLSAGYWASDVVWDASSAGLDIFEGAAAVRSFLEDWTGAYEEYEYKHQEGRDLGN